MKKRYLLFAAVAVGLIFGAPRLSAQSSASVTLAWDPSPSPSIVDYVVRYGATSGSYSSGTNVSTQISAQVTGLQPGQTYYFAVTARDALGIESAPSNEVGYQMPLTTPPAVALTSPLNGSGYTAPATVNLAASVTANGHTITKVQFYNGATLLSEDTSSPYSYTWGSVSAGSYSLKARVVYDAGSALDSTAANVTVTNLSPPAIALTSPATGTSYTSPATINLAASVTANGHTITKVQFYNGATLLSEDTSSPYSYSWGNVSAGSYSLTARVVYDAGSTLNSTAANVTVTNLSSPAIVLTSPATGASYTSPANINLAASVTANGHTITKVQFYNGATLLGEAAASPYSLAWTSVGAGNYSLTARAVYDSGSMVTSSAANVSVTNPVIAGLTFAADAGIITAPFVAASGTVYQTVETGLTDGGRAAYAFTISTAGDYVVSAIVDAPSEGENSFYVNIDAEPTDPYMIWHIPVTAGQESRTVSWQGDNSQFAPKTFTLSVGTHQLIVRGREANTKLGTITISPSSVATPPVVALTSPTSGAAYSAPATLNLAASVTANGHTITKVQFYNGATLLGEDIASPYSFTWNNVAAGGYSLTARAVYDAGSTVDSASASVTVTNVATLTPIVALTSPSAGANYTAPASINLTASVTANGHTITKVQFYNGATLLGESTAAPYFVAWANVGIGNYTVSARAYYDSGSTIDSAPVNIAVTLLPPPWQTVDIGTVALAGNASEANGAYTVKGSGNIAGKADSFRFVYQPLSGGGDITARIDSMATNGVNRCVGVMIRESLAPNSRYAFMGIGQNLKFRSQRRNNTGGSTSTTTSVLAKPPNAWTRVVRASNTLTAYSSPNGTNWTKITSASITMAANIYVGFVVASGSTNTMNTSVFSNVSVTP